MTLVFIYSETDKFACNSQLDDVVWKYTNTVRKLQKCPLFSVV